MIKKYILLLLVLPYFAGCSNDDGRRGNPYLPDYSFSVVLDMINPQFAPLEFTGNPVFVSSAGAGINGIIVMNTGSGFAAFDAMCPNQNISSCSLLEIDGISAICPCDNVEYSLFTGLGEGVQYPLKAYRVEVISDSAIRVFN